jgi:hypothetical protein
VTITRDVSHYAIPYIRMNDTFNVEKGGGKIVNSKGGINQAGTNNRPAAWVDYSAPLDGQPGWEGLACMIHPDKNRHISGSLATMAPGDRAHRKAFTTPRSRFRRGKH